KKMDMEVYVQPEVGQYFNQKFISYKIQLDSTGKDADIVKASYADARFLEKNYQVSSYPTFLIFTPDGKILNRMTGGLEAKDFVKWASDVSDPKKNYYLLLDNYRNGKRD